MSIPASIWNVVIPVSRSPRMIAHAIGAAPRYRGSSDAWTLMDPRGGTSSTAGGRICPNATTTATSAATLGEALGPAWIAKPDGLEDRDPVLERGHLDGRRPRPLAPAGRPVRLRHGSHDAVAGEERAERGEREGGSAVEQHAHGLRPVG